MAINRNGQATKYKFLHNGRMLKKGFHNSTTLIWSAGSTVTYKVDTGVEYTEEVDSGATCLAPKTFTPTKDGWTFVGWREDSTASGDVLTNKVMDSEPITLYAVFKQKVTLTYYDNSSTASKKEETRYYNSAGNYKNPSFAMTQTINALFSRRGWATSNAADASIVYANGATIELTNNLTIYGCYSTEITLTYYDNSSTKQTKSGTRYYNSAGNYKNPSFTLTQVAISGWTARGWSTGTAGNSSITYNNNTAFTRDSNVTLYGCYSKSVTLSYNGNGATSGSASSQSGTAYRNYAGTIIGASFTLRDNGFSRTNHAFTGWNLGAAGAQVTLNESTTAYAQWRLVSLILFDNGTLRSGDSFAEYEVWSNDSSDDTALREASCGNTLYAYGRTANYDRYSVAYGMFNKAIDLSGFTKLRVTIQSASIVSSNNSRWFAGLRNNIYAGGSQWADLPWLNNCVVLSEATGGTFDVDLTAYKNAYGNTAYFLFGAGKINGNHPSGGAWVHIAKVWLE